MNVNNSLYDILGVSPSSSDDEIKKAYKKLARRYHPDRNPNNPIAENAFKDIVEAYDVLKDENKRKAYDQIGHEAYLAGWLKNPEEYLRRTQGIFIRDSQTLPKDHFIQKNFGGIGQSVFNFMTDEDLQKDPGLLFTRMAASNPNLGSFEKLLFGVGIGAGFAFLFNDSKSSRDDNDDEYYDDEYDDLDETTRYTRRKNINMKQMYSRGFHG